MGDPQDKHKTPPELLEDGDDKDLDAFSVVVEPDTPKGREIVSSEVEKAHSEQTRELHVDDKFPIDIDEYPGTPKQEDENAETSKFQKYEGPGADSTDYESYEDKYQHEISQPSIILGKFERPQETSQPSVVIDDKKHDGRADGKPVKEPEMYDSGEKSSVAISRINVIGEEPVEKILLPPLEEEKVDEEIRRAVQAVQDKHVVDHEVIEEVKEEPKEIEAVEEEPEEIEAVEEDPEEIEAVEEDPEEIEAVEEDPEEIEEIEAVEEEPENVVEEPKEVEEEPEKVKAAKKEEGKEEEIPIDTEEVALPAPPLPSIKPSKEEGKEEEIPIDTEEVALPAPPLPPIRPSKEPPPPPPTVKMDSFAPPPPAAKGVSMKSIAGHLPSIISIPDDEIPREVPVKKVPVKKEEEAPAKAAAVETPAEAPIPEPIPRPKKKWYEEIFNEDYIRLLPILNDFQKKRELNFVQKNLDIKQGSMVLDIACGMGTHCIGLAERGYQMVGLDLSFAMLAIASEEAQMKGCKINFIQKDLRDLYFSEVFDAAYCIGSSFGYFDDEDNEKVIKSVHKALKSGGIFLLEVDNRDFVLRQCPGLLWFEGDGVVTMEETAFDFITSRLKVKRQLLFEDGSKQSQLYSLRLYSIHELGRMLHKNGFRVDSVGGHRAAPKTFIGEDAAKIIILAQKR